MYVVECLDVLVYLLNKDDCLDKDTNNEQAVQQSKDDQSKDFQAIGEVPVFCLAILYLPMFIVPTFVSDKENIHVPTCTTTTTATSRDQMDGM